MSTYGLGSEHATASGVGGPNSDFHVAVAAFAEVADILDQAKRLSLFWGQNGGGGSPVQSLEKLGRNLCASLDNLSTQLNVASQALDRLIDSVERFPPVESPVVLMKKEASKRGAGSSASSKEDRNRGAPDMPDSMHPHGHGKLTNKVEEG